MAHSRNIGRHGSELRLPGSSLENNPRGNRVCLLYTSDAADERSSVDLGGRRIIKKKKTVETDGAGEID